MIVRSGRVVLSWGDLKKRYDLKSSSKSIGFTAFGLALADGKLRLDDLAIERHPGFGAPPETNRLTGWLPRITLRHLATQTAGFAKPGGYEPLLFAPGKKWAYSDGGPNWLAECVTLAYGRDIEELLFERVFTPIGIEPDDLRWRENSYRPHEIDGVKRREFGSGVHANVDAMARIGWLYLNRGRWGERQLIPAAFAREVGRSDPAVAKLPVVEPDYLTNGSRHYGLLWWNNADGSVPAFPRDAYWTWGLYESLIVVVPSFDMVIARAGRSWEGDWAAHYDKLKGFFGPIAAAVQPPYPPSPVIKNIRWAPPGTIRRQAPGSDNWPLAWGADDALYTAYGDGWGFRPKVEKKLSLGFAKILGGAEDFRGVNIRSPSGERVGQGAAGEKASGMLMVDGVLYMWVRNAGNSQLASSSDRGRTWRRADWKFTESFGAPTFLSFGKNYSGSRDDFVYIYSHDNDSAYGRSDRMALARAPKDRLLERGAYEFFAGLGPGGEPRWTPEIARREAVFTHLGRRCYRSGITYNAGLKRYLWVQIIPGPDTRFGGGFGGFDAPEPWGPWTTAFLSETWDVGPGETASFPPKWMSADGRTLYLVFTGDDAFSVRKATIELADER